MNNSNNSSANCWKVILLGLITLWVPMTSYAKDVTFQWTANPETLSGYKLYYKTGESGTPPYDGTGINEGSSPILIDNVTTFSVTGLSADETYHFTLTAYNELGESGFSEAIAVLPDSSKKPIIINITVE